MDTKLGRLSETKVTFGVPSTYLRAERFAGRHEAHLAKAVGLTQFGVNHVTLDPGAYSSLRHWHEGEDEFVYILSGELTLIDENGEHILRAGDYAAFPAGVANAHHLTNRSSTPGSFMAVGTRKVGREAVHYPDDPQLGALTIERDTRGNRMA
jgi:uncharacterized cupin superfamily protein